MCSKVGIVLSLSALELFFFWTASGASQGQRQGAGLSQPWVWASLAIVALLKPLAMWGVWPTVTRCHFHYSHMPSHRSSLLQKFCSPADPVNRYVTLSTDRVSPWLPADLIRNPTWILSVSCLYSPSLEQTHYCHRYFFMWCQRESVWLFVSCPYVNQQLVITFESAFRKRGSDTYTFTGPVSEGSRRHHATALLEQMYLGCKMYMPHVGQLWNKIKILIKVSVHFPSIRQQIVGSVSRSHVVLSDCALSFAIWQHESTSAGCK